MARGPTHGSDIRGRLSERDLGDAPSARHHSREPCAGLSSFYKISSEQKGSHKAFVKRAHRAPRDLTLLKQDSGPAEAIPRVDPACFVEAAGGKSLPADQFVVQLFETKSADERPKYRKSNEATDPITHFNQQNTLVSCNGPRWRSSKRSGYNSKAAKQSWTFAQDRGARDAMGLLDDTNAEKTRYLLCADGVMRYQMWGAEDMQRGATKDYLKSDRAPEMATILRNDRDQMPYCCREKEELKAQRLHHHGRSDRIWDALQREEGGSEDEQMDCRRPAIRRTRSAELSSFTRGLRQHAAGVKTDPYDDVVQTVRPATPSESRASTHLDWAHHTELHARSTTKSASSPKQIMSARPSRANGATRSTTNAATRSATTRSATTRSEASLSMTPLSITNASLAARRQGVPRAATQRSARHAS